MTRKVIAVLFLAAAFPASSTSAQSLADPYQIFARARAYWHQQTYPPLLEYTVAVTVFEGGSVKTERYWSAYDSVNQQVAVDSVSDYEQAHPTYAARGFNFAGHGQGYDIPFLSHLLKPQPPTDYLGVPVLTPNYTFGLAQIPPTNAVTPDPMEVVGEVRASFRDPSPTDRPSPSAPPGTLPIIEKETAYDRTYRVTLDGVEAIYGVSAYHLKLQALRDPGRYRLEELWVDTRTFAPIQLVERFNFVEGPGTRVPWRVRFANVDGELYIYDEAALAPMRYDGLVYPQASVAFENIHGVDQLSRPPPPLAPSAPLIMTEP
ncbi:MAG TPA: hypothetical protein VFE16_09570 [Candidatus Cybelea sp.]|nr:hypothetical protein [Candidatus Cybelea sp.]